MSFKGHENTPLGPSNFETYTHMNTWAHVFAALLEFYSSISQMVWAMVEVHQRHEPSLITY
jgi:hypothetical protein